MTTGLPGVSPQREAELMHIRAQAQAAKPAAEAAAMQRSAEKALDQQANKRLLDEARETKRLKELAARNLEYEKAANAFKKVSRNDIEAYSNNAGRVKVQQEVPSEIYAALPPEEDEAEEKTGFHPFRGIARATAGAGSATAGAAKTAASWVPFVGKKKDQSDEYAEPPSPAQEPTPTQPQPRQPTPIIPPGDPQPIPGSIAETGKKKGGMFNFLKRDKEYIAPPSDTTATVPADEEKKGMIKGIASAIPFVGKKKDKEISEDEVSPFLGDGSGPGDTAPAAVPAPAPAPSPAPLASGAALFGPQSGSNNDVAPAPAPAPSAPALADAPPSIEPEKKGMFSGFKNLAGKLTPGKKNQSMAGGPGNIDSSLFPESGDGSQLMADTSGVPSEKKKLTMPSLPDSLIPAPPAKPPEAPKPPMPKKDRSPMHSGGSDLYVVEGGSAQFLRFGSSQMGSETLSLQSGTIVRMTKVGDEWSSVQLSDGATGIVRNKALRPANSGETSAGIIPGVTSPPIAASGSAATTGTGNSARITRPVSATGAGTQKTPGTIGPPVSIPESRLTSGGTNSGLPQ